MTQEDSYFVFKLVSGEEVIALTTMDDSGVEPCFYLADSLKVELTHKGNHTMVRLVPWITILVIQSHPGAATRSPCGGGGPNFKIIS